MTNRREFLQAAAIAGLPALAGASASAGIAMPGRNADLRTILIDERHAEARSVGCYLASAGATVHTLPDGDITQLWLSTIGPAWRQHPAAVAGLTARPALFCLEQLALTSGLRVVYHAEHIVHADGHVGHFLLRGAEAAQLSARDLTRAGPLWPGRIAEAIATHRHRAGTVRPGRSDAALEPTLPRDAQLLTSWIIAAV